MFYHHNVFAKSFGMAKEIFEKKKSHDLKLQLISHRKTDGKIYNLPKVYEIAALISGDGNEPLNMDIILQLQSGKLQRINELHVSYLGLQYPILFSYGEDGYRNDVKHREQKDSNERKRTKVTIKEFHSFRLQARVLEAQTLCISHRLFQHFIVDGYIMMESECLFYIRTHQKQLCSDKYSSLQNSQYQKQTQPSNCGKCIILLSFFSGGRRYMDQLYFEGMSICSYAGFQDLFLTFTCNPCWPEILRDVKSINLMPQDRPNIVSRVFKLKLEQLMTGLKSGKVLGNVVACKYVITFKIMLFQFMILYIIH